VSRKGDLNREYAYRLTCSPDCLEDESYIPVPQLYFPINVKNGTPLLVAVQKESEGLPTPAVESEEDEPAILHRNDFVLLIWLRRRLAAKVLEERIAGSAAVEAGHVVRMIENGMTIAREMARGLTLVLSGNDNLCVALEELAAKTREHFGVECLLRSGDARLSLDDFRAIHLYRIAQEAINKRDPPRESRSPHRDALPSRRPGHPHLAG
jgi:hypothetical protein